MFLADKIINLRKKAGWSQEELAGRLGVTRQSVSKWEGAQSVPDIEKIVQLSRLFSVTTDYLLKDELEEPEPVLVTDAGTQENPEKNIQAGDYGRGFRLYEAGKRKCPKEGSGNLFMGEFAYCTDLIGIYE